MSVLRRPIRKAFGILNITSMASKRTKNGKEGGKAPTAPETPKTSAPAAAAAVASVHEVLERGWLGFFKRIGQNTVLFFEYFGGLSLLALQTLRALFRYRFPLRSFLEQCEFVGNK